MPDRFISSAVRQRATPRRDMWASIVDDAHPSRQPSPEAEEPLHSIHGLQVRVLWASSLKTCRFEMSTVMYNFRQAHAPFLLQRLVLWSVLRFAVAFSRHLWQCLRGAPP